VLDYSSLKTITIEEELEFIDLYVAIENERFQGLIALNQEVDCDELISIPPLLIQPLIENAIIYGFRNEEGKIHINFSIKQLENELRIEIKNEINPDMLKNHGYQSKSTEIIQKRLRLYDGNLALSTTIKNSIFTATLFLPISD
jgi:sensor histidine kinase YesM